MVINKENIIQKYVVWNFITTNVQNTRRIEHDQFMYIE